MVLATSICSFFSLSYGQEEIVGSDDGKTSPQISVCYNSNGSTCSYGNGCGRGTTGCNANPCPTGCQ